MNSPTNLSVIIAYHVVDFIELVKFFTINCISANRIFYIFQYRHSSAATAISGDKVDFKEGNFAAFTNC